MTPEELLIVTIIVVVLIMVMLFVSNNNCKKHYLTEDQAMLLDHTNMRHTNFNGMRLSSQRLPELGASGFMNARYKVVVDDSVGDNIEPLSDLVNAGFKNPAFEHDRQHELPDVSQTKWNSHKSSPEISSDDKQLQHDAAEMMTPGHRVEMSKKSSRFLPHTGGKSRLAFSSFENSNNEAPFRQ